MVVVDRLQYDRRHKLAVLSSLMSVLLWRMCSMFLRYDGVFVCLSVIVVPSSRMLLYGLRYPRWNNGVILCDESVSVWQTLSTGRSIERGVFFCGSYVLSWNDCVVLWYLGGCVMDRLQCDRRYRLVVLSSVVFVSWSMCFMSEGLCGSMITGWRLWIGFSVTDVIDWSLYLLQWCCSGPCGS